MSCTVISKKHIQVMGNRSMRFLKSRILHANDSPHRIAMGAAVGLFVAWTPALGLHMLMALALTILLRANKFVAIACVWVSNPFTVIAIYYPNYLLGKTVLKFFYTNKEMSSIRVREMLNQYSLYSGVSGFFHAEFWQSMFSLLWRKGPELWLGSVIMGLLVAFTAYFVTYYFIIWYRKTHPHRRFRQHQ